MIERKLKIQSITFLLFIFIVFVTHFDFRVKSESPFRWMKKDNFDLIMEKMSRANPDNCETLSEMDLRLEPNTLNQLPSYDKLKINKWFANRTKLLHLHNIALNRGFFYSYVLQRLNTTVDAPKYLPMLMYYYFSAAADISSGPNVLNVSAVLYDTNCSYADWFLNKDINTTLPLFGPMARRLDNWNDEMNFLRVPSNQTIEIHDLGAGPNSNYTASWYKNNPYIRDKEMGINFIPDFRGSAQDKPMYITKLLLADIYGNPMTKPETKSFFGPNAPGLKELNMPVRFTRPYFDCGKTNRWLVSAVSSVTDYMPRYSSIDRLRGAQRIAVTLASMDFLLIDFNPCPPGQGNEDYFLAGTARCKPTTMCVPISGFGFARGGYECVCQPGHRLPVFQVGPFRGVDIEQATQEEYESGFDCIPVGWREVYPQEGRGAVRKRRSLEVVGDALDSVRQGIVAVPGIVLKSSLNYLGYSTIEPDNVETKEHYMDNTAGREDAKSPVTLELQERSRHNNLVNVYHERLIKNSQGIQQSAVLVPKFQLPDLIMQGYQEEAFCRSQVTNNNDNNTNLFSLNPVDYIWRKDSQASCIRLAEKERLENVTTTKSDRLLRTRRNSYMNIPKQPFYTLNMESVFVETKFDQVHRLITEVETTTELNCAEKTIDELNLPGEVSYGVDKQFEMEGRTALRLAHFLSAYYQNNIMGEVYGSLKSGYDLNKFQLFGEVIANVLSNFNIESSGIYYDYQTFKDSDNYVWDLFAPYAFKPKLTTQAVEALDMSMLQYRNYTETSWFRSLKERWSTSTFGLERYLTKAHIRSQWEGFSEQRYFNFPMYYRAARYEDGFWTHPYFDCYGPKKDWLITYAAPFFGPIGPEKQLTFMGVVTVSVQLLKLDINQCPQSFYTPNYFKNTAKCPFESTFCQHIPGRQFTWGSYKCQCRQGYEFPLNSVEWYFDGQTMEKEFIAKRENMRNRFDILRCRQSGAPQLITKNNRGALIILTIIIISFFYKE